MASTNPTPKILLTGATGYIGGTILTHLLNSPESALKNSTITCLVRGQERAATLSSNYGARVNPVVYKDIDDIEATVAAAAQHDLVINTTIGWHLASAQALLRGLAQRKAQTGRDVWYIHTSGTSNVADRPISGAWIEREEGREFDDARDDVYEYEVGREARHAYAQRTTELGVVDTGLELGVKTLVIMSPTIHSPGTGLFNTASIQIPMYVRGVLKHGHGVVVGSGKGTWDHVHVEDLAELYVTVVRRVLEKGGEGVPTGKKGIIFSGNGRHTWMDVVQVVVDVCYAEGRIPDKRVESIGLAEGARIMNIAVEGLAAEELVELALASNARTVSSVARSLGWKPTRGEGEEWRKWFAEDVKAALEKIK
ncbi:hypothetical protein AAE478_001557 [Parahypoxylon ruwenzoriense]